MPYLGNFDMQSRKSIVIFEINSLEFIKFKLLRKNENP